MLILAALNQIMTSTGFGEVLIVVKSGKVTIIQTTTKQLIDTPK